MKLIESKAELLTQEEGVGGIYKQIELAGRTCYKSEDKITIDSSTSFVERMINSGHTAMLEHGTVYLRRHFTNKEECMLSDFTLNYHENPYSKVSRVRCMREEPKGEQDLYITTNYRVLVENGWQGDLKYLCPPTEYHEKRISMRFVTDRGVSHELVRHRVFSFAQESTRYCNYGKDKFGNEITFIIPSWCPNYDETDWDPFLKSLHDSENTYLTLIEQGNTPQQARQVLPNALKTEIVVTGFVSDWKHFFDLRYFGTTGKPHPDMLLLTAKAKKVLEDNHLWNLIYPNDERSN